MSFEADQLAWLVLQMVNRMQAKSSTARIVVPRDAEVVNELGRELGTGPTEDQLILVEEYLHEHGYIFPVDIGLTRASYTITPAGLNWLKGGLPTSQETVEVASGVEGGGFSDAPESPVRTFKLAERVEGVVREERTRLLQELEDSRQRAERLEAELERLRRPWWRRMLEW